MSAPRKRPALYLVPPTTPTPRLDGMRASLRASPRESASRDVEPYLRGLAKPEVAARAEAALAILGVEADPTRTAYEALQTAHEALWCVYHTLIGYKNDLFYRELAAREVARRRVERRPALRRVPPSAG